MKKILKRVFESVNWLMYRHSAHILCVAMVLISCGACQSKADDNDSLKGTLWKLVGVVDAKTGDITEIPSLAEVFLN